jgi:hypothetical protein
MFNATQHERVYYLLIMQCTSIICITEFSLIAVITDMYGSSTFLWRLSSRTLQMDVDK